MRAGIGLALCIGGLAVLVYPVASAQSALGLLLTRRSENATVTLCHTGTRDLAAEVRRADIVIAAAGVPGIITPDMVQPGAAVLSRGGSVRLGKGLENH